MWVFNPLPEHCPRLLLFHPCTHNRLVAVMLLDPILASLQLNYCVLSYRLYDPWPNCDRNLFIFFFYWIERMFSWIGIVKIIQLTSLVQSNQAQKKWLNKMNTTQDWWISSEFQCMLDININWSLWYFNGHIFELGNISVTTDRMENENKRGKKNTNSRCTKDVYCVRKVCDAKICLPRLFTQIYSKYFFGLRFLRLKYTRITFYLSFSLIVCVCMCLEFLSMMRWNIETQHMNQNEASKPTYLSSFSSFLKAFRNVLYIVWLRTIKHCIKVWANRC